MIESGKGRFRRRGILDAGSKDLEKRTESQSWWISVEHFCSNISTLLPKKKKKKKKKPKDEFHIFLLFEFQRFTFRCLT